MRMTMIVRFNGVEGSVEATVLVGNVLLEYTFPAGVKFCMAMSVEEAAKFAERIRAVVHALCAQIGD